MKTDRINLCIEVQNVILFLDQTNEEKSIFVTFMVFKFRIGMVIWCLCLYCYCHFLFLFFFFHFHSFLFICYRYIGVVLMDFVILLFVLVYFLCCLQKKGGDFELHVLFCCIFLKTHPYIFGIIHLLMTLQPNYTYIISG